MSVNDVAGLQQILLVEDDLLIREMYQLYLEDKGFKISTASDGDEALEAAKKFHPDLIFLALRPELRLYDVQNRTTDQLGRQHRS